jgi:hypothetical protein
MISPEQEFLVEQPQTSYFAKQIRNSNATLSTVENCMSLGTPWIFGTFVHTLPVS